ncbi:MAG: hypothetical protein KGJ46_12230 [Xanthomonadaceae bacterium]|nr:hypothetical protein [Xanthomonadaceae bacterium]MDE2226031.1 hypothetical protein [Xanthomonadaceae bacterium]
MDVANSAAGYSGIHQRVQPDSGTLPRLRPSGLHPRSATETEFMNLRSFVVRLGGAALLAAMFTLAACNGIVRHGGETTVNVPARYDMTIGAYKDNQFMLDGAVLSSPDLEAHFRYLQDQKQLPKTVLLEDTDDAKINNADLEEFASLQLSFKFTGYVMHKGKLTLMSAVESAKDKKKK